MYKEKFNRDGAIFMNVSFLVQGKFADEWSVHPLKKRRCVSLQLWLEALLCIKYIIYGVLAGGGG